MANKAVKKDINAGKILRGRVVSAKLPKTATVLVGRIKTHPLYRKSFKVSKKYLVHSEIKVEPGDVVEIIPVRPMSKNKHFQIYRVIGKDMEAIITEQLKEEAAQEIAEVMPEQAEGGKAEEVVVQTEPKQRKKKVVKKEVKQ